MASDGIKAFEKYFQHKNVVTSVRYDTPRYDITYKKTQDTFTSGSLLSVYASSAYDTKPLVKDLSCDQDYRISFAALQKPTVVVDFKLKPQHFNVCDVTYTPQSYENVLKASIDTRFDGESKDYLISLLDYHIGKESNYPSPPTSLDLYQVRKDFGECIGPLHVATYMTTHGNIYIPQHSNEPMLDYVVDNKNYSAKAHGTTGNTVKSQTILQGLEKNGLTYKWENTLQYKVLYTLANNSVKEGAIKAAELCGSTVTHFLDGEKAIRHAKLDYLPIFKDALRGNITYVKFDLQQFKILHIDDINSVRFRSQNSSTRSSTKMGLNV